MKKWNSCPSSDSLLFGVFSSFLSGFFCLPWEERLQNFGKKISYFSWDSTTPAESTSYLKNENNFTLFSSLQMTKVPSGRAPDSALAPSRGFAVLGPKMWQKIRRFSRFLGNQLGPWDHLPRSDGWPFSQVVCEMKFICISSALSGREAISGSELNAHKSGKLADFWANFSTPIWRILCQNYIQNNHFGLRDSNS